MKSSLRPVLMAVAVAVVVLFAAFGSGYSAARLAQSDGGVWLSGEKNVLHVNTPSNAVDARAGDDRMTPNGQGSGDLQIVVRPNGDIIARNPTTGEVFRIDPTTNAVVASEQAGKATVLVGGHRLYLVENDKDGQKGTIVTVDDYFRPLGAPMPLPGGVNLGEDGHACPGEGRAVVDPAGVAWIGMGDGRLGRIDDRDVRVVDIPDSSGRLCVTLVDGQPMVVDAERPRVVAVRSDGSVARTLALPDPGPVRNAEANTLLSKPGPGPYLWVVVSGTRNLVRVDVNDSTPSAVKPVEIPGHASPAYGRPTVVEGRVYLPDLENRRVHVIDARAGRPAADTPHVDLPPAPDRPAGERPRVEIVGKDGKVFINDPAADRAVVVGSQAGGNQGEVDKNGGATGPAGPGERRNDGPGGNTGGNAPVHTGTPGQDPNSTTTTAPGAGPGNPDVTVAPTVPTVPPTAPTTVPQTVPPTTPNGNNGGGNNGNSGGGNNGGGTTPVTAPPSTTPPVNNVAVPPVSGDVASACRTLNAVNLRCQVGGAAPTAQQQGLAVTGTNPRAGATVQAGSVVTVNVRSKPRVPSVVGKQRAQACIEVQALDLECRAAETGTGTTPEQVTSQSPQAGTEVETGSKVIVAYVPAVAKKRVPTLVGKNYDIGSACSQVELAGLVCKQVPGGAGSKPNEVLGQNPAPNTELPAKSPVYVTFATTTKSEAVPNVVGMSPEQGCKVLDDNGGFVCRKVDKPAGKVALKVVDQNPDANARAAAGSEVVVTYYKAVLTVPPVAGTTTCKEVQAKDLGCSRLPKAGGSYAPGVNHSSDPASGTPVDPDTAVKVFYDPTVPVPNTTDQFAARTGKSGAQSFVTYENGAKRLVVKTGDPAPTGTGWRTVTNGEFSLYLAANQSCKVKKTLWVRDNNAQFGDPTKAPTNQSGWANQGTFFLCAQVSSAGFGDPTPGAAVLLLFTAVVLTVQHRRSRVASPLSDD